MADKKKEPREESTLEHARLKLASVREKLENAAPQTMRKNIARIRMTWQGDQRFETSRAGEAVTKVDGKGDAGQSPVDLLLTALSTCVSIDVVEILMKRRTPVTRMEADVSGRRADTVPRRFTQIQLDFIIDGEGIDRENAERAIELSMTKYCSVHDSLATDLRIDWSLCLNGEKGPQHVDPTRSQTVSQ